MKKWKRFYNDIAGAVEHVGQHIADVVVETYEIAAEAVDDTKYGMKHVYKDTSKVVGHVGQHIADVAVETYETAVEAVDDTRYAVEQLKNKTYGAFTDKIDDVIDASIQRIQTKIEKRIECLATDVQAQMVEALLQRQTGLILLDFSIAFGTLSGLLLSFALVYCVVLLFVLPLWIGFLGVCAVFGITSVCCFQLGQQRIKMAQRNGLQRT